MGVVFLYVHKTLMKESKEIMHDGVVRSLDGEFMSVEILSKSACSGCEARSLCSSSDQKSKMIEVVVNKGETYQVGQSVTVVGSESMGIVAVVLCYVVPVVLMVLVMVVLTVLRVSDVTVGLSAIGVLMPYFFLIYLMRDKFRKSIVFRIRNKIE